MEKNKSKQHDVTLPGSDYVLKSWKVKSGSPVQRGQTIAYAVPGGYGLQLQQQQQEVPIVSVTTQHKRPKKRKRGAAAILSSSALIVTKTEQSGASNPTSDGPISATADQQTKANDTTKKTDSSTTSLQSLSTTKSAMVPIVAPMDGLLQIENSDTKNGSRIGWIQKCNHPTIMDGLCAVCGRTVKTNNNKSPNSTISPLGATSPTGSSKEQQRQVTVSGGVTMVVSEEEAQSMARQSCNKLLLQRKLSLVLDLDHTLVHATADPRAQKYVLADKANHVRTLLFPLEEPSLQRPQVPLIQHFVKLRPHVKEFLTKVMPMYEVSIYTAGTRSYANQVIMVLCRHVVGATLDQVELHQLQHDLHVARHELLKVKQQQQQDDAKSSPTKSDESKETDNDKKKDDEQADVTTDNEKPSEKDLKNHEATNSKETSLDGSAKKTRKKVSFGALPPAVKTDAVTQERVDELEKQWKEAETLEAKAMELRQSLFGSRTVTRTDVGDLGRDVKSLKRVFPCGGTMAAIVDDREDVWTKDAEMATNTRIQGDAPENLLHVRPYHWKPFVGFADVNNASGKVDFVTQEDDNAETTENGGKNSPTRQQDEETDEQLLWTGDILERLHKRFYNNDSANQGEGRTVPNILREMRREVLAGKRVVMSGLIPLHKQQQSALDVISPRPIVVRYAESLGATVMDKVRPDTTHVIGARDGTDKILMARKIPGCAVVKALWLTECLWSLTLRDMTPHYLGRRPSKPIASTNLIASPITTSRASVARSTSSSDSSSDDDDFAAELENEMMTM